MPPLGKYVEEAAIQIDTFGVSIVVQRKWIWLGTMRLQVRSLTSLSGLRIRRCPELWCRSQTQKCSFSGHLGCFPVLAFVNIVAMKLRVQVYFSMKDMSRYMPRRGREGSYDSMCLFFSGISILFSVTLVPSCIPTNSEGGLPFLHILSSICYCWLVNNGQFETCEVIPHGSFDLHLSKN